MSAPTGATTLCFSTRGSRLSPASVDSAQSWLSYGARSSYSRDAQAKPLIAAIRTAAEGMVDQPEKNNKNNKTTGSPENSVNNDDTFLWVTSNTLDGFRKKEVMTKIRKAAMHDHLRKNPKNMPTRPRENKDGRQRRDRLHSVGSGISNDLEPEYISNEWALRASEAGGSRRPSSQSDSTQSTNYVVEDEDPPSASLAVRRPTSPQWRMGNITSIPNSIFLVQTSLVIPPRPGPLPYDLHTVGPLQSLGVPLDPFRTMPQISHPRVSIEQLKFHCSRFFGTKAMGLSWVPALIRSRHAFLSTLCIASTHLDATNNRPTESIETVALRHEVIHLIGQSLLNPLTAVDDFTIIALVQLICSEIVVGNETVLKYHEDGMEAMIKQRGGLERLGVGGELASVLTAISFQSAIFRETQPLPIYLNYCATLPQRPIPSSKPIPESPLFCPRLDFETIKTSARCEKHTLDLLIAVRDMTDLFLDQSSNISASEKEEQLNVLYQDILSLPSSTHARVSNSTYGDWIYEACRIAAVIQATAIVKHIPLSHACALAGKWQAYPSTPTSSYFHPGPTSAPYASPLHYRVDSVFHTPSPGPADLHPPSLLHALRTALSNSDLSDCWGDMAGVLFWVALVGGAAARRSERPLRKWIVAMSVRCSVVLAFEHGTAVVGALRMLLRVTDGIAQSARGEAKASRKRRIDEGVAGLGSGARF